MKKLFGPLARGRSTNSELYRNVFVKRVHWLLAFACQRLDRKAFQATAEPAITGKIVESIEQVLDDPSPEIRDWCECFFVADDPPENTGGRLGKTRKRVDIRFVSSEFHPRCHFRLEAKRLNRPSSVNEYFGPEGLGCFLSGQYGPDDQDAGMLGYVQLESSQYWADRLERCSRSSSVDLSIAPAGHWKRIELIEQLEHSYQTKHIRTGGAPLTVYHTLMRFAE